MSPDLSGDSLRIEPDAAFVTRETEPVLDGQGRSWKEFVEALRYEQRWTEGDLRAWRPATAAEKWAAKAKG